MTRETVIHSRDKKHDRTNLREQSHIGQPTLPCRRNIGPCGYQNWRGDVMAKRMRELSVDYPKRELARPAGLS